MTLTDPKEKATVHIQRVVRGFLGRMEAIQRANEVYEKILDPRTAAYFYYNTRTLKTTWEPPAVVTRILGELGDLDRIAPTYGEEQAAVILQAAWRRRQGARTLRSLLASVVTKILDDSTGAHYYFNSCTGETSWSKPDLFGSEDVENYLPSAVVLGSGDYEQGEEVFNALGTDSYGYDEGKATSQGTQQDTDQQQAQMQEGNSGHEGWVWDDEFGWYYDEGQAIELRSGGNDVTTPHDSKPNSTDSDNDSEDSDKSNPSGTEDGAGGGRKKIRWKVKRAAPRIFPRSRAQRLVDEIEDSVEGACPLSLDLSKLDMTRVTSRIYGCTWLETLDLSSNRLNRVSPDISAMDSLVDVNLRHNRLKTIPDELEALTRLKHLRVGYNRIEGFRGNIYLLSSLQTLDLGHNRMKQMPLQVGDLQLLKRTREWEIGLRLLGELLTLDVSYNKLISWPPQVEGCSKLKDLRLDHNQLTEIPETLAELKSLTNLNLGRNSISCLPKVVNSLSGLASLDISHNRLKIAEILQTGRKQRGLRLVSLERLKLQNNELTEGPTAADTLTTLTELDVSHNPILHWKPDFTRLRKMKILRLSDVGLGQCPEGLGKMDKLEIVDFSGNELPVLDQAVAGLFKLKYMNIKGNRIQDIGSCVGSMMSLTYLDAGSNGLTVLPPELSRCTALEHLDFSQGQVEFVDDELSRLTKLRILRAHDNRLTEFPAALATLTELEELRVDGNRLRGLPDSLKTMTKMRYAELSRNRMESPPAVTRQWPLLRHLVLSRNPLKGRQTQSRRLLQAAQRGNEAMHRGDWEEATNYLNVAAEAYEDAIRFVPDFPEPGLKEGIEQGAPLAETRPHAMDTLHHERLGMGHLEMARELKIELDNMRKNDHRSLTSSQALKDGSSVSVNTSSTTSTSLDSSMVPSIGTTEREERRQKEQQIIVTKEKIDHHAHAAISAFSCADQIVQLSRPMGRSAGVWLGRAAAFAEASNPASALHDLELASAQTRNRSKVRLLLARSRIELGQYERGLMDCRVALRCLEQEERLLNERETHQKRAEEEAEVQAKKTAALRRAEERSAGREKRILAAASGDVAGKTSTTGETTAAAEPPTIAGDSSTTGEERISSSQVNRIKEAHIDNQDFSGGTVPTEATIAPVYHEQELPSSLPTSKKQVKENSDNGGYSGHKSESSNGGSVQRSELSLERAAIQHAKKEMSDVKLQGEQGLQFVKQSVDMADLLRGFAITPQGIPIRDMARDRHGLLQGRSVLRERHHRIMAVEAAKKRARKHDVGLMERALRQISTRQEKLRRARIRSEDVMLKYREQEEALERRREEEMEEANHLEAVTKFEQAVKAQHSLVADVQTSLEKPSDDTSKLPSRDTTSPAVGDSKGESKEKRDIVASEDGEEDEDDELKKLLAGRARRLKRGGAAAGIGTPGQGVASSGKGEEDGGRDRGK